MFFWSMQAWDLPSSVSRVLCAGCQNDVRAAICRLGTLRMRCVRLHTHTHREQCQTIPASHSEGAPLCLVGAACCHTSLMTWLLQSRCVETSLNAFFCISQLIFSRHSFVIGQINGTYANNSDAITSSSPNHVTLARHVCQCVFV
jgi:hypothetical protein